MALRFYSARQRNILVALCVAAVFFLADFLKILNFYEEAALDLRLRMRGQIKADSSITLVEIDDKSLAQIGTWPWPAKTHAALLGILESYKPALIFYDVFFGRHANDPGDFEELAVSMERNGNVIIPFLLYSPSSEPVFPLEVLQHSARASGFSYSAADADGRLRRAPLSVTLSGTTYYHSAVLSVLSGMRDEEKARDWLAGIPTDRENRFLINFPGGLDSFSRIPFYEVLNQSRTEGDRALAHLFRGKIVLIGLTASGSHGMQPVVFSPALPSLAVHAGIIDSLLQGRYLRPSGPLVHALILFALCLLTVFFIERSGPRKAGILVLGATFIYIALNYLAFSQGLVLPLFNPVLTVLFCYLLLFFQSDFDLHFRGRLLERELSMASKIQETFLPHSVPKMEGVDAAFMCRFAKEVGGDFYDWIDLGTDRLGVAVGDVSGKGVPAALYMARALSEFRRENQGGRQPGEVLTALNNQLAVRTFAGMFLTITYVIVDQREKQLYLCSAGHEPGLYFDRASRKAEQMHFKKGPPVGVFTDSSYVTVKRPYSEGDVLMLLSDGVPELRNTKGSPIGIEKIKQFFETKAFDESASSLTEGLFALMDSHLGGGRAHDDRTILCVKFGKPF
jgi:CHASE2 domain-containing sensor protein